MIVTLTINRSGERRNLCAILAENGYPVWVEKVEKEGARPWSPFNKEECHVCVAGVNKGEKRTIITLTINRSGERRDLCAILAENGYRVWVNKVEKECARPWDFASYEHHVHVEVPEISVDDNGAEAGVNKTEDELLGE